jgi:G3E family GTPase
MAPRVPVIALTGRLGAGKTTLLNHLLRQPGARVGVVVNDFGAVNIDAGLVAGQVDEAASIAGGCVCCLDDAGGLDDALERLTHPRLRLDAVVVEASGIAEPVSLARLIHYSGAERVRLGGVVEVVDALHYAEALETERLAPARFAAATLVVVNKCDQLPADEREAVLARIEQRVHERSPAVPVVRTSKGRVDPALVFDVASTEDAEDELPLGALLREGYAGHDHTHARAATVRSVGPVDPGLLLDLLEDPPPAAYRLKGTVTVDAGRQLRRYVVNVVGRSVHVATDDRGWRGEPVNELVAIGLDLDVEVAKKALETALAPYAGRNPRGFARLQRHRRLSL